MPLTWTKLGATETNGERMDLMLTAGRVFHLGYVVPELDAGMAELGALFGLDWAQPLRRAAATWDPVNGRSEAAIGVAYSSTGPPHIEVIEGEAGSLWEPGERPYLHHIGMWAEDLERDAAALVARGLALAGHGVNAAGGMARFSYHRDGPGPLIELVDPKARDSWEAWMRGEPLQLGSLA